ncbi:MAG: uracil-DNA glycosylase [Sulfurospirillaceae bacterium]|nr:uracil-DNA glycosylase [Sulfurospirillaceae bacterium]
MTQDEKIRLLKLLYQYRAMGFEYFKEYRPVQEANLSVLPNTLEELKEAMLNCHLCQLAKTRKKVVFGEGNAHAKILFIGEGPGASEDDTGRPFVGRAGELLTKMIENVLELSREDVYIANVVKCRPPENRVPTHEEVSSCKPYLMQQIRAISPKIIVALGSTAFHHLTGEYDTPITKIRGEVFEFEKAKLIPTYHPSYLLRNPSAKKEVYLDMLKIKRML